MLVNFILILSLNSAIRFQNIIFLGNKNFSCIDLSFMENVLVAPLDVSRPFLNFYISYLVDYKIFFNNVIYLLNDLVLYWLYRLRLSWLLYLIQIILKEILVSFIFLDFFIQVQIVSILNSIPILVITYKFIQFHQACMNFIDTLF